MRLTFTILGPPRTKKNHNRLVRAGRRYRVLPSAAHERWYERAWVQAVAFRSGQLALGRKLPLAGPVHVRAIFYRDRRIGDLVGYQQALGDLLERAGIIENDRQIVSWDGTRLEVDRERPRIEVGIGIDES